MRIEVLYIDGCPHFPATVDAVKEALGQYGLTSPIIETKVGDQEMAVSIGFLGSPTVRINGLDSGLFAAVFLTAFFAAFAGGAFTVAFLTAAFFRAVFLALADCAFAASALFCAQRFFVAAMIAFLPAALSFRSGFEGSGVAFDGGLERFTVGFFAFPEDACKLTASFARMTAAFAS